MGQSNTSSLGTSSQSCIRVTFSRVLLRCKSLQILSHIIACGCESRQVLTHDLSESQILHCDVCHDDGRGSSICDSVVSALEASKSIESSKERCAFLSQKLEELQDQVQHDILSAKLWDENERLKQQIQMLQEDYKRVVSASSESAAVAVAGFGSGSGMDQALSFAMHIERTLSLIDQDDNG